MLTVIGYVIALIVVGGLLFLAASFAFGRGEELAPVLPEGTPAELPDGRLADGDDLRALRLSVTVRGYRMEEVDWVLDRLAEQVDSRDREIARLRSVLHVEPVPVPDDELYTHPGPNPPAEDPDPGAASDAGTDPEPEGGPGATAAGGAEVADRSGEGGLAHPPKAVREPGAPAAGSPRPGEPVRGLRKDDIPDVR